MSKYFKILGIIVLVLAILFSVGFNTLIIISSYKNRLFTSGQQNVLLQIATGVKEKPVELAVNLSGDPTKPELINLVCTKKEELPKK